MPKQITFQKRNVFYQSFTLQCKGVCQGLGHCVPPFQMSEDKEKIAGSHRRTGKENSASRTNELSFSGREKSMCLRRWRTRANSSESDRPKEVTKPSPSLGVLHYASGPRKSRGIRTGTWACVREFCLFSEETTSGAPAAPCRYLPTLAFGGCLTSSIA